MIYYIVLLYMTLGRTTTITSSSSKKKGEKRKEEEVEEEEKKKKEEKIIIIIINEKKKKGTTTQPCCSVRESHFSSTMTCSPHAPSQGWYSRPKVHWQIRSLRVPRALLYRHGREEQQTTCQKDFDNAMQRNQLRRRNNQTPLCGFSCNQFYSKRWWCDWCARISNVNRLS